MMIIFKSHLVCLCTTAVTKESQDSDRPGPGTAWTAEFGDEEPIALIAKKHMKTEGLRKRKSFAAP